MGLHFSFVLVSRATCSFAGTVLSSTRILIIRS
jgi:hypothetical protein